jgi:nucleoside-diphosphate-sugar epimerase
MLDNQNILITGATGFIGRHLVPLLTDKHPKIYVLIRESSKAEFLRKQGVVLRYGDLLDKPSLRESLKDIDVVIHLAALMSDKDYLPRSSFLRVNNAGTMNIVEESRGRIKQFIHISTVGVYGRTGKAGVDERHPYGINLSNYEYSKVEAEKSLLKFSSKNNFPFTILRIGQLYGPGMHYGWPDIFQKMERGRMFIIGKGDRMLQLTYITDAVSGIMMTIGNDKCIRQIFNICADKAYSLKEIFHVIAGELGVSLPGNIPFAPVYLLSGILERLPRVIKPGSARYLNQHRLNFFNHNHVYDIGKAVKYFGYSPAVELRAGMQKTIKWYTEYKKGDLKNG